MACQADYSEGEIRMIRSVEREMLKEEVKFLEKLKKGQHHWLTYQIIKIENRINKINKRLKELG
jgi:hypothetical protein